MGARDAEIERWFIRRVVPHFIDDYAPTTAIWNRSLPMLVIAYVAGGFNAIKRTDVKATDYVCPSTLKK